MRDTSYLLPPLLDELGGRTNNHITLVLSFGLLCIYREVSMTCCRKINAHANHNLAYNVTQREEIQRKNQIEWISKQEVKMTSNRSPERP